MMPRIKLLCVGFLVVLASTTIPTAHGAVFNPNLMMRMILANDKMYQDMLKLKTEKEKWAKYLPEFIKQVKTIMGYAERVHAMEPPSSNTQQNENDYNDLVTKIKALPYPMIGNLGDPWRPLYYSHVQWWDDTILLKSLWDMIDNGQLKNLPIGSNNCPMYLYKLDYRISASKVCSTTTTCERDNATPYSEYNYYPPPRDPNLVDESVSVACTSDNSCNATEALPMMTSMLFTNINKLASTYVCALIRQGISAYDWKINHNYEDVENDVDLILAFAYSQPDYWKATWNPFFTNVFFGQDLHLTLDHAVSAMQSASEIFSNAKHACKIFPLACSYADIYYKFYQNYENMCRKSPTAIKDLRLYGKIDYGKMVELKNINLDQIKIFTSIHKLDENLETSVSGISSYFEGLAKFDKGIAQADADFITGKLEQYNSSVATVQEKLEGDLKDAMIYMMAILSADVVDRVTLLAEKIATNCNPIKQILSGPDLSDITSLAGDVANALANFAHGAALLANLNSLIEDINTVNRGFAANAEQLSSLKSLTNQILQGTADELEEDADKFLAEYAAYTPQVDKASIIRNNALWSAFKDSTCTFLTADRKLLGSVPKGIANAQLLCERLEATLAEFFAIRENVFDFQFQLVDALAQVVRGNLAQKLAANIKVKGDAVNAAVLLTTFFITYTDIQTVASSYCTIIEYNQLGQSFTDGCATVDGRFREPNLDQLIAYSPASSTMHEAIRHVTIPAKPRYPGDMSFIDLNALANGQDILFKLPKDRIWLQDHRWIHPGQAAPKVAFVKSFELYFPHKNYGSIQARSEMTITIKSIAGSFTSTQDNAVEYLLPAQSGTYLTTYEENYSSCLNEITNPYSLCSNLPNLCRESSRYPGKNALLPTIMSTWSVNMKWSKGSQTLSWSAPHQNSTSFLIHGTVVLQTSSLSRKRRHLAKRSQDVVPSSNGCCDGDRYKVEGDQCKSCPAGLTARLRGVYCEETLSDSGSKR